MGILAEKASAGKVMWMYVVFPRRTNPDLQSHFKQKRLKSHLRYPFDVQTKAPLHSPRLARRSWLGLETIMSMVPKTRAVSQRKGRVRGCPVAGDRSQILFSSKLAVLQLVQQTLHNRTDVVGCDPPVCRVRLPMRPLSLQPLCKQ